MKLSVEQVTVRGRTQPRLDGVSLAFDPGAPAVLVGPNGAGKSTLLRVLAGLLPVDAGRVTIGERALASLDRLARAARVAWLPQDPRPEEGLTAEEAVASARFRLREPWPAALAAARRALDAIGSGRHAGTLVTALSGGEARRVHLASLAAQEADWWLLDEPGNHLDPAVRLDLLDVVRARTAEGGGVVLVTHDLSLLSHLPDARVIALDQGRVVHDGPADDPALPDALGPLFRLDLRSVDLDGARRLVIAGRRA